MTTTAGPGLLSQHAAPRLGQALGEPRLTAGVRADGRPATYEQHVESYDDPAIRARAGAVAGLLARNGILGRGGAGFPLLVKMQAVQKAKGKPVVVVNASEGEPAIWKDRLLLAHVPHLVLDGAQLAAAALGADRIHIAVNPMYPPAHAALTEAIRERQARANDVAGVTVHVVPDEFTAGEASAVVGRINGGNGRPEFTKVIAAIRGVDGRPTLLSNTETYAQLAIMSRMGDHYGDVGFEGEPGTALFTVRGAVPESVVMEAPLGTTVGALIEAAGGLTEPVQAVLVGGFHGKWLPMPDAMDAPLAVHPMRARGGSVGAGLVLPLATNACPLAEVVRVVRYLAVETAGQCGPCVNGMAAVAGALDDLAQGHHDHGTLDRIARWSGLMIGRGNCKHPDGTVGFVSSALTVFSDHIDLHLHGPCKLPFRQQIPVGEGTANPNARALGRRSERHPEGRDK